MNAQDRCDRCAAAAVFTALMPSGLTLLFCGHHAVKYSVELAQAGAHMSRGETAPVG